MLLPVLLMPACATDSTSAMGVSDDQFIETMVALRREAAEAGSDTAAYRAARDQVLARQGVTADELRAYVAARARDLDAMAAVWESINVRLTSETPRD